MARTGSQYWKKRCRKKRKPGKDRSIQRQINQDTVPMRQGRGSRFLDPTVRIGNPSFKQQGAVLRLKKLFCLGVVLHSHRILMGLFNDHMQHFIPHRRLYQTKIPLIVLITGISLILLVRRKPFGATYRTRTCNRLIRSQGLYPVELRLQTWRRRPDLNW